MFKQTFLGSIAAAIIALTALSAMAYTVPANNRVKFNLDIGWKLNVGDPANAQAAAFNDAAWQNISLPHAWNEDDAFANGVATGIAWYRKHFAIPATYAGSKVFVEFEEIRQAGQVYCNGTLVGRSENGVTPSGFDITPYVNLDGTDNVIAVRTDNSYSYTEVSTGTGFQWNRGSYTTNFGGITQNAYLHIAGKLYQTLPLFVNLQTQGPYIYGTNYSVTQNSNPPTGSATINAQTFVKNETAASQTASFSVDIVDMNGNLVSTLAGNSQAVAAGATVKFTASGNVPNLNLWTLGYGYLYDVYTIMTVNGVAVDVVKIKTGFRKLVQANGNITINDRIMHLKGYAWRSQNPWPAIGDAFPAWMADFQHNQILDLHGNFVRPMHVCALVSGIESADRIGIGYDQPAGDAEGDVTGVQWEQRKQVMRTTIIYHRNNPSVFMYEAGNSDITEAQMQEMNDTIAKWDPNGGRTMGCRGMLGTRVAQWAGEMLYINKSKTRPRWMTEYSRNESPRRWWDQYSPPEYHVNDAGGSTVAGMNMNQDEYIKEQVHRWWEFWTERPGFAAAGPNTRVCAGGVKIEMADGTTFARSDENYRRSGVVDAMRIPKNSYGAFKVMWNGWIEVSNKDVFIVGHWNYPANTTKNVYVVSNCDKVELFVNNVSKGFGTRSWNFLFTYSNIAYAAGTIKAVGYDVNNVQKAVYQIATAGTPAAIKLTPHVSPAGLKATGSDFALIDAEVVDAQGNRCPTTNTTITYAVSGQGQYRGGMAGGKTSGNYVLSPTLPVECGMSRISVRTTTTAGNITVTATAGGLTAGSVTLTSSAYPTVNGLTLAMPGDGLPSSLGPLPPYQLANPAAVTIFPTSCSAGTNSYDDYENTSSSGTSITYNIPSQAVSSVHIKFSDFRNDHTFTITVGGAQAWSGTSPGGLGYSVMDFPAKTGGTVTVSSSGSMTITEAEIYGPGTIVGVNQQSSLRKMADLVSINKYSGKIVVSLPDKNYTVSMVDLFGRLIAKGKNAQPGKLNNVVFDTKNISQGVYLFNIRNGKDQIQKKIIITQ